MKIRTEVPSTAGAPKWSWPMNKISGATSDGKGNKSSSDTSTGAAADAAHFIDSVIRSAKPSKTVGCCPKSAGFVDGGICVAIETFGKFSIVTPSRLGLNYNS